MLIELCHGQQGQDATPKRNEENPSNPTTDKRPDLKQEQLT